MLNTLTQTYGCLFSKTHFSVASFIYVLTLLVPCFHMYLTLLLNTTKGCSMILLNVTMSLRSMQRVERLLFSHEQKGMLMKYHCH